MDNPRKPEAKIDDLFINRWSPRSFSSKPIEDWKIQSLFEAARWAPSSMNEQPWRFIYAKTEEDLETFREIVNESNRRWAKYAPLLMVLATKLNYDYKNRPNSKAEFDAGSAWMSLALRARQLDLYAHAMGGIHPEKAYELLNIPEDEYKVICAIAVGYNDSPDKLPTDLRESEKPNSRKPLREVASEASF